jgi:hypothetical protein
MTIAIGFTCAESFLVCADTQLTVSGVAKLHGSKIFREEGYANGAKSAIAIAGTVCYARMAMQHIEQRIGDLAQGDASLAKIRTEIEEEIIDMHEKHFNHHPDRYALNLSIHLLLAIWSPVDNRARMFWTEGTSVNELRGYQTIGIGSDLAHQIVKEEGYIYTMPEARVRPIAVKAIAKAKYWVDGCGGFTEVVSLSRNGVLGEVERLPIPAAP